MADGEAALGTRRRKCSFDVLFGVGHLQQLVFPAAVFL